MIAPPHDVTDTKVIRFAQINFVGQRCYPGLSNAEWYPILDRECLQEGVILKVRDGARFVWKHHLVFRDLLPPS